MRYLKVLAAAGVAAITAGTASFAMQDDGPAPKMKEAPSVDQRYAAWEAQRAGQPVQAMVQFDGTTADARVRAILSRHNVRPYAVYMFLDGRYGAHTADPGKASLDLIEEARQTSVGMQEQQGKGLQQRAQAMLDGGFEKNRSLAAALPDLEARRAASLDNLKRGVPIIYGARVVGSAAALQALAKEAGVAAVAPGVIAAEGRVGMPSPTPPAATQPIAGRNRTDAEVQAGLRALAGR